MTVEPITDDLKEGFIENQEDHEECDHCGGIVKEVTYNAETETYKFDDDGIQCCKDCHTTPNGNLLDVDVRDVDELQHSQWPYERCEQNKRDTYSNYSVRLGKKPVILNGGFEEAYRDPENGVEYCLEEYGENPHHDGLIIWG